MRRLVTARGTRWAALLGAAALVLAAVPAAAGKSVPAPESLAAADSLAATAGGRARDRALRRWAKRASLADLQYVLRRPPAELAGAEAALVEAALERAPASRQALRRRLVGRLMLADPRRKRPKGPAADPPYPRASVFRVAALLPDSGDYRGYSQAVLEGLRAALDRHAARTTHPIELEVRATGVDQPQRVIGAFDSVADRAGVLVGELLSVPTLVLATAARFASLPLVSPTATDEAVGAIGTNVFQIGPSAFGRGLALAGATVENGSRVGVLISSAVERGTFARGFLAGARSAGAAVVWSETYAPGSGNFAAASRSLAAQRVEFLFWDGEAREAEALVRQLARDKVSLRVCGGEALAPEQHHAQTRPLLEGVTFVGEDWKLSAATRAGPDTLTFGDGSEPVTSLHVHGYLAGSVVAAAVASGALCPEEVTAFLESRMSAEPYLVSRGFLDPGAEGAALPLYTVRRGRAVRLSEE